LNIDNLDDDEIAKLWQAVRDLKTENKGSHQTIARGQTRFEGDQSWILEGTGTVIGTLYVEGDLDGDGNITWRGLSDFDGDVRITKTLKVTANTELSGPTLVDDTLDVTAETRLRGDTTLESNMTVKDGGSVKVEGPNAVTLGMTSADVPGLEFEDGGAFVGVEDGVQLNNAAGNGFVYAAEDVGMQRGSTSLDVTPDAIYLRGPVFMPRLPTISGVSANVAVDPVTGELGTV
jgi:hypothetical protein